MSVYAILFVMIIRPRAPCCLEIEDIEVWIFRLHMVKQIYSDLIFRVSESAHFSIFAIVHVTWIRLAELALVLLRMVEFLNPVMGFQALLPIWDALIMCGTAGDLVAHLACVRAECPSPVFFEIMVVKAPLGVVLMLILITLVQVRAWLSLEFCQI